jgi:cobalt-zinc-cadmium efflux system outer membrane protein
MTWNRHIEAVTFLSFCASAPAMRPIPRFRRLSYLKYCVALAGVGFCWTGCALPGGGSATSDAVSRDLQEKGADRIRPSDSPTSAQLPPGVALEGGLDEPGAVAIALWNNAMFQENLTRLGFARADLAQAGMLANPTLSMLFPVGPKQLEFTATLPLEVLWLRQRRVAAATLDAERIAQGLVQSGLDLARDVRVALSEFHLASDRATIAQQVLTTREQISAIAQNRLRLGDTSEVDALSARAELERAREESSRCCSVGRCRRA